VRADSLLRIQDEVMRMLKIARRLAIVAGPNFEGALAEALRSEVFASEAVARTWSIQSPWDRPDFYRSGLPHANARGSFRGYDPKFVQMHKFCCSVSEIRAIFRSEAQ
jgi:hypothetical protein